MIAFRGTRHLPVVRQTEAAECGLACLAMIAAYHGYQTDLATLRHRHRVSLKGSTLRDLVTIAARLDLGARPLKVGLDSLGRLQTPCILHWNLNHFVVLKSVARNACTVADPALGERRYSMAEVSSRFTGVALELRPTANFKRRTERQAMKLTDLWKKSTGLGKAICQTLLLSVIVQLFALAAPFYMQLVVDEVLTRFDADLLPVLATGFGLIMLINVAATALRAHVILYLGSALGFQVVSNLFGHLLRLPLAWFERRHVGDILSRFSSTGPIRDFFAEGLVASVIDGLMAVSTLIVILIYSPRLGVIVLAALVLYLALRFGLYRQLRQRNENLIVAVAREQSTFIESVRGIQSLKLFGHEADRCALWQNHYADVINGGVNVGKLRIGFESANGLLFGIENILVVYIGAQLIIDGSLTIGMLFAFMAYKTQFVDKAGKLVERFIEFRLLGLHLERISDIALTSAELERAAGRVDIGRGHQGPGMNIALRGVSFRYGMADRWLLKDLALEVAAGEMVAVTGPSGSGKTTLLKIITGLLTPDKGTLTIDGIPLEHYGRSALRGRIGSVMQNDTLFAGSIGDNITFFDTEPDKDKLRRCADCAAIHSDITAMPMAYNSLVGEMGSVLSAGQRQRVMLARALYREPDILVLDEGTANLDARTEIAVVNAIRELDITRICVAHGKTMIAAADRVVLVQDGMLQPHDPCGTQSDAAAGLR